MLFLLLTGSRRIGGACHLLSDQPGRIEVSEHVFDALFVILIIVIFALFKAAIVLVINILASMLELAIPSLLEHSNFLFTEVEPTLQFGTLLDAFLIKPLGFFILRTVHFVQLLLSDVLQLKSYLRDLTHVHATCLLA